MSRALPDGPDRPSCLCQRVSSAFVVKRWACLHVVVCHAARRAVCGGSGTRACVRVCCHYGTAIVATRPSCSRLPLSVLAGMPCCWRVVLRRRRRLLPATGSDVALSVDAPLNICTQTHLLLQQTACAWLNHAAISSYVIIQRYRYYYKHYFASIATTVCLHRQPALPVPVPVPAVECVHRARPVHALAAEGQIAGNRPATHGTRHRSCPARIDHTRRRAASGNCCA